VIRLRGGGAAPRYDRAVHVRGVVWAGVRTDRYTETFAFFRDVIGVPLVEIAPGFAWSKLEDSSQFEIFGPPDTDHAHFTTGPVPEFLVDDLQAAAAELEAAGVEPLGPIQGTAEQGWLHFRAPDGNVYGLTDGASYRRT
jgi:predicted enzyme related to lactoylglutathione lyase